MSKNGYTNIKCKISAGGGEAEKGPCAGEGGVHYSCYSNGANIPFGAVMSCPCCEETEEGANLTNIWRYQIGNN